MSSSSSSKFLKSNSPLLKPIGLCWPAVRDCLLCSRHFLRNRSQIARLHLFNGEQILQQAGTASADSDNPSRTRSRVSTGRRSSLSSNVGCVRAKARLRNVRRNDETRTPIAGALYENSAARFLEIPYPLPFGELPANCDQSNMDRNAHQVR